jgi:hypothetical protein
VRALVGARQSVPRLGKLLRPAAALEGGRAARLFAELDSDDFVTRQKAEAELGKWLEVIEPALRKRQSGAASPEVRWRVRRLLRKLEAERAVLPPTVVRAARAVEVLEHIGSPQAKRLLERLAAGAPGARLTADAAAAVQRLARRPATAR